MLSKDERQEKIKKASQKVESMARGVEQTEAILMQKFEKSIQIQDDQDLKPEAIDRKLEKMDIEYKKILDEIDNPMNEEEAEALFNELSDTRMDLALHEKKISELMERCLADHRPIIDQDFQSRCMMASLAQNKIDKLESQAISNDYHRKLRQYLKAKALNDTIVLGFYESQENQDLIFGNSSRNPKDGAAKVDLQQAIQQSINDRLEPELQELRMRFEALKKARKKAFQNHQHNMKKAKANRNGNL